MSKNVNKCNVNRIKKYSGNKTIIRRDRGIIGASPGNKDGRGAEKGLRASRKKSAVCVGACAWSMQLQECKIS